jgi:hypothetical protein
MSKGFIIDYFKTSDASFFELHHLQRVMIVTIIRKPYKHEAPQIAIDTTLLEAQEILVTHIEEAMN